MDDITSNLLQYRAAKQTSTTSLFLLIAKEAAEKEEAQEKEKEEKSSSSSSSLITTKSSSLSPNINIDDADAGHDGQSFNKLRRPYNNYGEGGGGRRKCKTRIMMLPDEGKDALFQPHKPIRTSIESVQSINDLRELCEQEFERTEIITNNKQDFSSSNSSQQQLVLLPKFHYNEIQLGKILGTGSFATVLEVRGFHLSHQQHQQDHLHSTTTTKEEEQNKSQKTKNIIMNSKIMSTVTIKTSNTTQKPSSKPTSSLRDSETSTETATTVETTTTTTRGSTYNNGGSSSIYVVVGGNPNHSNSHNNSNNNKTKTTTTKIHHDSLTFIDYDDEESDDDNDDDDGTDGQDNKNDTDTDNDENESGGGRNSSKSSIENLDDCNHNNNNNKFLIESREFIAKHCCLREQQNTTTDHQQQPTTTRYAVKRIRPDIWNGHDHDLRLQGIADMARETHVLSMIDHPNIIRLRAKSFSSMYEDVDVNNNNNTNPKTTIPTEPPYFLIIDRLNETLSKRIQHWKSRKKKLKSITGRVFRDRQGKKRAKLGEDVIMAQFELSSALCYLHSMKRICHRDLKPENIGFDFRGDLKLFDLGLAKELHDDLLAAGDGTYHLTEACGTPRYMASEVACGKPYNESCDVYSFALLCWQMASLKSPYGKIGYKELVLRVWGPPYNRPTIDPKWPSWLKDDILSKGWSHNINERPSMKEIESIFAEQVGKHKKEFDLASHLTTRRSTMVLQKLESMTKFDDPNNQSIYIGKKQFNNDGKMQDMIVENRSYHGKEEAEEFHVSNPYFEEEALNGLRSGSGCFRAEI